MKKDELLYVIKVADHTPEKLGAILKAHPEIRFVSYMGVDFAGNDTDEKVPMHLFTDDIAGVLQGDAAQTDGSSVVLPGIATLNDARVDMRVDTGVNWFVDYNYEHVDEETGRYVGTLRVPCFLIHNGEFVDSRSILKNSLDYVAGEVLAAIKKAGSVPGIPKLKPEDIDEIVFTNATELEFWVKTPSEDAPIEALSASQIMQEQYWARTRGNVRTAIEQTLEKMEQYGLEPEMGHKEVGGVRGSLDGSGHLTHVMEQLEIDWKYAPGLQAADNEMLARILTKETFRLNGLDVTFQAKPIEGVAGSGEHTHIGMAAKLKNGKTVNLFSPENMTEDFMSAIGYGALMGLLKNYEVLNPIVSCTMDSLNRLQPGFEAPICIVTSLGNSPSVPSRNRTILCGLVRDIDNPYATRFEMRSPNPFTNTYIAIAAFYLAALDGIKAALASGMSTKELEKAISKKAGEESFYLEKDREYRTEKDVFEDYTPEERNALFGEPPATVWENLANFKKYPEKRAVLTAGGTLKDEFIDSFAEGAMIRWRTEILNRLIPETHNAVMKIKRLHDEATGNDRDDSLWFAIQRLRRKLAQDSMTKPCLLTKLRAAIDNADYKEASALLIKVRAAVKEMNARYHEYGRNII